jgi:hypothetical protein
MATAVKRLDLTVGEIVEIAGRRYEVVPDSEGVTLEPPITPAAASVSVAAARSRSSGPATECSSSPARSTGTEPPPTAL